MAEPARDAAHTTIHMTGPVLVAPGEARSEAWIVDGKMTYRRPDAPASRAIDGWVVPGLVDAHCHLGLVAGGAADDGETLRQARTDAAAGTLLVRDCGTPGGTRWLDARADVPRVVRAGRHIARSGRYLRGVAVEVEPEDLIEAVRKEARAGDGWVKLVADWIDRSAGDLAPAFPAVVVRDAVEAAHEEGARVTAHSFAEATIDDLLDAGIDCIEHATGLLPRHIARLADQGVPIVPTLVNVATFPEIAMRGEAKFPAYAARMRALWAGRFERVAEAHAAGVRIFAGTDAGTVIAHGRLPEEVALLAEAIGSEAALDAASWSARSWLGSPGLGEGEPADLIVLDSDPRQDVTVLARPRQVLRDGIAVG